MKVILFSRKNGSKESCKTDAKTETVYMESTALFLHFPLYKW